MDTGKIREGPDTREEGPWPPAKVTTTPDRRDAKPQAAFIYDKELAVEAQTRTAQRSRAASRSRSYAGGGSRRRSQVGGEAAIPSAGVKFDSHWISLEDGRRVRLVLNGSYDSRRVSWVRKSLLKAPGPPRGPGEDAPDEPDDLDGLAGAGLPAGPLAPEGSSGVAVLV